MKSEKKARKILPEVHVLGDLEDVKALVTAVNKKKALVIFRNPEENAHFLEFDGKFKQIDDLDLPILEEKYKVVYFSFFPSLKKAVAPGTGNETKEESKPGKSVKKDKKTKKAKPVRKAKPVKKKVEN